MAHDQGSSSVRRRITTNGHDQHTNGNGLHTPEIQKKPVIDHEIPRKVLHSSIGFLTIYLYRNRYPVLPIAGALAGALGFVGTVDAIRLSRPNSGFAHLYEKLLGFLMRKEEKTKVNGVVWYLCGCTFSLLVFPKDVAVVSILILSWADTAASTVGRLVRSKRLPAEIPLLHIPLAPRKSRAGSIAAIATAALIAATFWGLQEHPYPLREISWTWSEGVKALPSPLLALMVKEKSLGFAHKLLRNWNGGIIAGPNWSAGWPGLIGLALITGLIGGGVEALDLGSLDDNLTLPILAGGAIWAIMAFIVKLPTWFR